jgi:hypothetical protein
MNSCCILKPASRMNSHNAFHITFPHNYSSNIRYILLSFVGFVLRKPMKGLIILIRWASRQVISFINNSPNNFDNQSQRKNCNAHSNLMTWMRSNLAFKHVSAEIRSSLIRTLISVVSHTSFIPSKHPCASIAFQKLVESFTKRILVSGLTQFAGPASL